MTIMSADCAERCGILRLMDTRYQGMASGVGTAKILGKIHMVQCKVMCGVVLKLDFLLCLLYFTSDSY